MEKVVLNLKELSTISDKLQETGKDKFAHRYLPLFITAKHER